MCVSFLPAVIIPKVLLQFIFVALDQCPKGGMINFSFACFEEMLLFSAKLQQPQLYIRP